MLRHGPLHGGAWNGSWQPIDAEVQPACCLPDTADMKLAASRLWQCAPRYAAIAGALCLGGCTTLGPMPMTTAQTPLPSPRPGGEIGFAVVPGYYLSDSVKRAEDADNSVNAQVSGMFEPGELIDLPGLSLGGRWVGGDDSDGYGEPMLRYRRYLDAQQRYALSGVAFGTHARGSSGEESYSATRLGLEATGDMQLTPDSHWVELHASLSAAATGLDADGSYCLDAEQRFGADCENSSTPPITATAGGVYPSATAVLALDFGRQLPGIFHGGRLALLGSVGSMPVVEGGEQRSARLLQSAGLSLTLGFGATE